MTQTAATIYRTTRDVQVTPWQNIGWKGGEITIPAGTEVTPVLNGQGNTEYAVESVELLIQLTLNTHDPYYRYVMVPTDAVAAV